MNINDVINRGTKGVYGFFFKDVINRGFFF